MTAEFDDKVEHITSTLVDYGTPNGDTSMARTTSLPLAICTRLVLEGHFTRPGLAIPTVKELYEPILKARAGIRMLHRVVSDARAPGAETPGHLLRRADEDVTAQSFVAAR